MPGILSTTDKALAAYLISQGVGDQLSVSPFKTADEKELPHYICKTFHAAPVSGSDGTFEVQAVILTRTLSAIDFGEDGVTKVDQSDTLVERVENAFLRFGEGAQSGEFLGQEITNAARGAGLSNFTCQSALLEDIGETILWSRDSNAWEDALTLKLVVCPSNVS